MIIVILRGGLGNQMFQYAYAFILNKKYQNDIMFSTFYQKKESTDRGVRLQHLSCDKIRVLSECGDIFFSYIQRIRLVILEKFLCNNQGLRGKQNFEVVSKHGFIVTRDIYKYFGYPSIVRKHIISIDGYFQSGKYLNGYEDEIRKLFQVPDVEFDLTKNGVLENKIINSNAVCLHVRRGDYTSDKWAKALLICDREYYIHAIEYMVKNVLNPVFYIFSNSHDDIKWIKENYKFDSIYQVVYVDNENNDVQDLRLMYKCKHFILSNSSYSWWGQFLCLNSKKIVIAPSKWTNEDQDYTDIYEKYWKIIQVGEEK